MENPVQRFKLLDEPYVLCGPTLSINDVRQVLFKVDAPVGG
jgi:hypothetical protein